MKRSRQLNGTKLLSLIVGLATVPSIAALGIEPTEYEKALLVERRSIVQIHLEMDTDLTAGNGVQLTRSQRTIWQDGEKRRCDEIREYLDGKGVTEVAPHRFVSIETPEIFLTWNSRPPSGGGRLTAYFGTPTDVNYKVHKPALPFDARLIGLTPAFLLHARDLSADFIIGTPERDAPAIIEANGDRTKVSFKRIRNKTTLTVEQIYERRGGKHLLRNLSYSDDGEYHHRFTMSCSYPADLVAGFTFPDAIESKYARDDFYKPVDYVLFQETSKIRVKSVNEAIPRSRFAIATAGLPAGTPVSGNAIPPELNKEFHHIEWNGEALVPVPNSALILGRN